MEKKNEWNFLLNHEIFASQKIYFASKINISIAKPRPSSRTRKNYEKFKNCKVFLAIITECWAALEFAEFKGAHIENRTVSIRQNIQIRFPLGIVFVALDEKSNGQRDLRHVLYQRIVLKDSQFRRCRFGAENNVARNFQDDFPGGEIFIGFEAHIVA